MKTQNLVERLQARAQVVVKKTNQRTKKLMGKFSNSYLDMLPYYCLISIFSYLTIEDKIKFEKCNNFTFIITNKYKKKKIN